MLSAMRIECIPCGTCCSCHQKECTFCEITTNLLLILIFKPNRKDDDYLSPKMSTDTFILYATAAILSTLTILFCLCHPEILTVICLKLKNCCCSYRRRGGGENIKNAVVGSSGSDDYVGGIQMERRQDGESERELVWEYFCLLWWRRGAVYKERARREIGVMNIYFLDVYINYKTKSCLPRSLMLDLCRRKCDVDLDYFNKVLGVLQCYYWRQRLLLQCNTYSLNYDLEAHRNIFICTNLITDYRDDLSNIISL